MEIFFDSHVSDFLVRCEDFIIANPALNNEILERCAVLSLQKQAPSSVMFISCFENNKCVGAFQKFNNSQLSIVAESSKEAISQVVDLIIEKEISIGRCFGAGAEDFVQCWQTKKGGNFNLHRSLLAYELSNISDCSGLVGHIRQATLDDLDTIISWRRFFFLEVGESFDEKSVRVNTFQTIIHHGCFLLEDKGMCCSAVNAFDVGYNIVRIGAVYTPKNLRGCGYARSLVQQVSASKLTQGKKCILDADLKNPISNHIYQKIGYVKVGELRDYILL